MLKKSLALILVFVMSLACAGGVVMADASSAPEAPAEVEGVTYYLNKIFTQRQTGKESINGIEYTLGAHGNVTYDAAYNAIKHNGYVNAVYTTAITGSGDFVLSMDVMSPSVEYGSNITYTVYIGSYKVAAFENGGKLYLAQQDSGVAFAAETWYRINANVNISSGDITVAATDMTTNTIVASKTQTGRVTSISDIAIKSNAVPESNFLYSQNWVLYKEAEKVYPTSPEAPSDVDGATYYLKKDFTAKPSGTETLNGASYTWSCGGNLAYNADYNAIKHAAYAQLDYASALASDNGKYMLSLNFMIDDVAAMVDYYQFQLNGYTLMNVGITDSVNSGNLYLLGSTESAYTISNETWYTLKVLVSYPDNSFEVVVADALTDEVLCHATRSGVTQVAGGITKFRISNRTVADIRLYTQSWRLYQLPQVGEPVPSDLIEGATYYANKYFTARPSGTTEMNGVSHTWTPGGAAVYDNSYNALKHAAFLTMEFSPVFTGGGKYVYSADFMLDGLDIGSTAYDFKVKGLTSEYIPFSIRQDGVIRLCNVESEYILKTYKWYTVKSTITIPEGKVEVVVYDNETQQIVAEQSGVSTDLTDCITWVRAVGGGSALNRMYTQNWSFCKLANTFEATSDDTSITASYTLEETDDAIIAIALYQGNKMTDISFVAYDDHKGAIEAAIAKQDGCTAKAFLWKGTSLKPVFEDIDVK